MAPQDFQGSVMKGAMPRMISAAGPLHSQFLLWILFPGSSFLPCKSQFTCHCLQEASLNPQMYSDSPWHSIPRPGFIFFI